MKAIILTAGYGKRMGNLADHLPKSLIPIINKPILQHLIESFKQSGIKDFIIVVGHLKDHIISFFKNYKKKGITLKIIEAKDFKKGPLYSFNACIDEILNEEFILVPADFILEPSILLDFIQKSEDQKLLLAFNDRELSSKQTSIHLSIKKKFQKVLGFKSNLIKVKGDVKSLLPMLISRINFQYYIKKSIELNYTKLTEALELYLREKNELSALKIQNGYWFDLDTIQDVLSANRFLLNQLIPNNHSLITLKKYESQKVNLIEPILLGKNCYFDDNCSIGPNVSIGDNCSIGKDVKIQNAIICPFSTIPTNTQIINAIFFKKIFYIN